MKIKNILRHVASFSVAMTIAAVVQANPAHDMFFSAS